MSSDDSNSVYCAALNADAMLYHAELVFDKIQDAFSCFPTAPDILSVAEIGTNMAYKLTLEWLNEGGEWEGFTTKLAQRDRIAVFVNRASMRIRDGQYTSSNVGKFCAFKAELVNADAGAPQSLAHISVHLPHKNGRAAAYALLGDQFEESAADGQPVACCGDYNMTPDKIAKLWQPEVGAKVVFGTSDPPTTASRRIDNMVVSSNLWVPGGKKSVLSSVDCFTHKPIYAAMEMD